MDLNFYRITDPSKFFERVTYGMSRNVVINITLTTMCLLDAMLGEPTTDIASN